MRAWVAAVVGHGLLLWLAWRGREHELVSGGQRVEVELATVGTAVVSSERPMLGPAPQAKALSPQAQTHTHRSAESRKGPDVSPPAPGPGPEPGRGPGPDSLPGSGADGPGGDPSWPETEADPAPGQTGSAGPEPPPVDPEGVRRKIQGALTYPRMARERELEGTVEVRFRVAEDGQATGIEVKRSAGAVLDQAAVDAIRRAQPFGSGPGWVRVPVVFELL